MERNELMKILSEHTRWLKGGEGEKIDLRYANLSGAKLNGADLRCVDLRWADLRYADLSDAKLSCTDLRGAKLRYADLQCADLSDAILNCADLSDANLYYTDLSDANLRYADLNCAGLRYADLNGANLSGANLRGADLSDADLSDAKLSDADLSCVDLSGAKGVLSQEEFLRINFERDNDGYIAYKTFGSFKNSPKNWVIEPGSILCENVNFSRTHECGCGINVAPLKWVKESTVGVIWRVRIRWEWLPGVCVPYNSNGQIRCEKVELIETVQR